MPLSNQQFENLLIKSIEQLDSIKEMTKVIISQSLQSKNLEKVNLLTRLSIETMDTTDLCKIFLINRSPNVKDCILFTLKVLKTNLNECNKLKNDKNLKDTLKICIKLFNETYNTLNKLYTNI